MKRVLLTLLFLVLPVLLVVWQVCFADTTSWYLVAAVLLLLSALPFFLHLERKPISAREMALLSVLTALAVVSRAVFYLIPQVKPIAAVVIVAGMCLGPFSGYMVGALSAFLSNFLFGQGIWTPFQMVALGLVGLLAGMLLRPGRVNRWVLALVGFFLATVVYGLVVDLSTVLMTVTDFTWPAVLAVYASGAPFDLVFGGLPQFFWCCLVRRWSKRLPVCNENMACWSEKPPQEIRRIAMNKTIIDKLARFAQTSAIIGLCLLGICPAFGIMAMVVPAVFKQKGAKLTEENQQLCHRAQIMGAVSLVLFVIDVILASILYAKFK